MKRNVMKKKKNDSFFTDYKMYISVFTLSIILGVGIMIISNNNSLTGFVVVSSGNAASIGNQKVADPSYGVAKGTLDFTLTDDDTVIGTSIGNNHILYFSKFSVEDLELIKASSSSFSGTLSNTDPDGSDSRCSSGTYTTTKMYYDEDDDSEEDDSEKEVYAVTTDANGCFAIKVKSGNNNIYG